MAARARTGPDSTTWVETAMGSSIERVLAWRRVVVGVAQVAAVNQSAVARPPVEGEGSQELIDRHRDQTVRQVHRVARLRWRARDGAVGPRAKGRHP